MSDTAENVTQIGQWAMNGFTKEQQRIELFLKLTRKNLLALSEFPISAAFDPDFKKFCNSFARLEKKYKSGTTDYASWSKNMIKWGHTLTRSLELL